jgi:pantoate--beta-alanine ligase
MAVKSRRTRSRRDSDGLRPLNLPLRIESVADIRAAVETWRAQGRSIGLVPTMGALHAGHQSLVAASAAENDVTVVSIFVNPLQFGPSEDFARYPRRLDADLEALASRRVAAVYTPTLEEMYPAGASTRVHVGSLAEVLEGAHRPGHFDGVATVVTKLLNATRPHRAYLGQKDAQQVAVIRRLVADLDAGVEIRVCPTVREADGLALSSRNAYLDPAQRRAATCLFRALESADTAYRQGERSPEALRASMLAVLRAEALASVDYAEVVDPVSFQAGGRLAVLAVRFGTTRLIDNHLLGEPLRSPSEA